MYNSKSQPQGTHAENIKKFPIERGNGKSYLPVRKGGSFSSKMSGLKNGTKSFEAEEMKGKDIHNNME